MTARTYSGWSGILPANKARPHMFLVASIEAFMFRESTSIKALVWSHSCALGEGEKKNSSKWIKMVHCANISSTYSTCHLTWPRDVGFSMVFLCSSACLDPHWSPTSAGLTLRQQQLAPPKTQRNRLPHPAPEQTWNLGWRIIRYHHQKLVILYILLLKRKPLKSLTVNSRWI